MTGALSTSGATAVEYALIVGLVAGIIVAGATALGLKARDDLFGRTASCIEHRVEDC